MKCIPWAFALAVFWEGTTMAQVQTSMALRIVQVDALARVFPDREPVPMQRGEPVAVPRGGSAAFQFVLSSAKAGSAKLSVQALRTEEGHALAGTVTIYEAVPVTVEANTRQAGTAVGKPAEERHRPFQIREAPFDVAEALAATDTVRLQPKVHSAILCDVQVAPTASPGRYRGALEVACGGQTFTSPLELEVYPVQLPKDSLFSSSHWFSELPQELTGAKPPKAWSEEHWALIARLAKQLHAMGDTAVHTVLLAGPDPMIRTTRKRDGSHAFDFARFDRWVKTFLGAGYTTIDGASLAGGHWVMPPDVHATDEATGDPLRLFRPWYGQKELRPMRKQYGWPKSRDEFVKSKTYRRSVLECGEFFAQFFAQLHAHLKENNWVSVYRQGLIDEPRTVQDYAYLSELCRKHMPGVKIADAIHGYGVDDYEAFSPHVDLWIMEMAILRQPKSQRIIAERRKQGLRTGVYILGKATPWPNRLLDRSLVDNRAQPWLMQLYGADYYIHWAANRYRGVTDPYTHSIGPTGPLSGGRTSTDKGHPPGNNWLLYPGPNGLRPSLRVIAFRDGALDYALLSMLAKRDQAAADATVRTVVRSATDHETAPAAYHQARRALLDALAK